MHLDPQVALHVALMLHELGINSVKHGALSRADGSVNLNWSVSDGKLHLQWAERGGPTVKAPLKCGFGTTLIEQTVKAQDFSLFLRGLSGQCNIGIPNAAKYRSNPSISLCKTVRGQSLATAIVRQSIAAYGASYSANEDEKAVKLRDSTHAKLVGSRRSKWCGARAHDAPSTTYSRAVGPAPRRQTHA